MMKKFFLLLIISSITCMGFAQTSGTLSGMSINEFVGLLADVKGFFFIGKGESRDLSLTLDRDPNVDLDANSARKMDWHSYNEAILTVNENGYATGKHYGETIISTSDKNNVTNYVVFVCPKITVASPEGAIYSYHKIYEQDSHIQFTESENYEINCVTKNGVLLDNAEISADGWYNSSEPVDSDIKFCVTMQGVYNNLKNDVVKITTDGLKVTIHAPESILNLRNIKVLNMWGHELYEGSWPSSGTLEFNEGNYGVFTILIPYDGVDNMFKIITEKEEL